MLGPALAMDSNIGLSCFNVNASSGMISRAYSTWSRSTYPQTDIVSACLDLKL